MSEEILKFNVPDSHWKHTLGTIMYFGSELNHPDRIYEKHAKESPEKIDELTKGKIFTILEGPYVFIFILEPTYFSLPNHHFFSMPFLPSGYNYNKSMLKIFCTDHNGIGVPIGLLFPNIGKFSRLKAKLYQEPTLRNSSKTTDLLDTTIRSNKQ